MCFEPKKVLSFGFFYFLCQIICPRYRLLGRCYCQVMPLNNFDAPLGVWPNFTKLGSRILLSHSLQGVCFEACTMILPPFRQ